MKIQNRHVFVGFITFALAASGCAPILKSSEKATTDENLLAGLGYPPLNGGGLLPTLPGLDPNAPVNPYPVAAGAYGILRWSTNTDTQEASRTYHYGGGAPASTRLSGVPRDFYIALNEVPVLNAQSSIVLSCLVPNSSQPIQASLLFGQPESGFSGFELADPNVPQSTKDEIERVAPGTRYAIAIKGFYATDNQGNFTVAPAAGDYSCAFDLSRLVSASRTNASRVPNPGHIAFQFRSQGSPPIAQNPSATGFGVTQWKPYYVNEGATQPASAYNLGSGNMALSGVPSMIYVALSEPPVAPAAGQQRKSHLFCSGPSTTWKNLDIDFYYSSSVAPPSGFASGAAVGYSIVLDQNGNNAIVFPAAGNYNCTLNISGLLASGGKAVDPSMAEIQFSFTVPQEKPYLIGNYQAKRFDSGTIGNYIYQAGNAFGFYPAVNNTSPPTFTQFPDTFVARIHDQVPAACDANNGCQAVYVCRMNGVEYLRRVLTAPSAGISIGASTTTAYGTFTNITLANFPGDSNPAANPTTGLSHCAVQLVGFKSTTDKRLSVDFVSFYVQR